MLPMLPALPFLLTLANNALALRCESIEEEERNIKGMPCMVAEDTNM